MLCTWIWVNSKCCVVCFGFYITNWFCRSFAQAPNIAHLQILVWLAILMFLYMFFVYNSLEVEPKQGQVLGVWRCWKSTKGKPLAWSQGPPFFVVFHFYFLISFLSCSPLSFPPFVFFYWYLVGIVMIVVAWATYAIAKSLKSYLFGRWRQFARKSRGGKCPWSILLLAE